MKSQNAPIVSLHAWLQTDWGRPVAQWEGRQLGVQVADLFGFQAVQLGLPGVDGLSQNRMLKRWLALGGHELGGQEPAAPELDAPTAVGEPSSAAAWPKPGLACDFTALPFDEASIDLLILPHALEWSGEATACLREAERVLRPEGQLIVTGFNPHGALAWRQRASRAWRLVKSDSALFMPEGGEFIAPRRLRDWLRLLNFEVEAVRYGLHGLPTARDETQADGPLDRMGARLWPALGSVYLVHAVKRVPGPMLMRAPRRRAVFASAPVQVARKQGSAADS